MSQRSAILAGGLMVIFGSLVAMRQILDYRGDHLGSGSIIGSYLKGKQLAAIPDIAKRGGGIYRRMDMVLPEHTRVFLADALGPTNMDKIPHYLFLTYYLFPREVAVCLDQPCFTVDGFQGQGAESDAELREHGFDVRVDIKEASSAMPLVSSLHEAGEPKSADPAWIDFTPENLGPRNIEPDGETLVQPLHEVDKRAQANPAWFGSWRDAATAFLLPLLTALSGIWLLQWLFGPGLRDRLTLAEQLAGGLGLGMMTIAALTLGVKLCGFHGRGLILALTAWGALTQLWRNRNHLRNTFDGGLPKVLADPVTLVCYLVAGVVFLVLFRLAAVQGAVEYDAITGWLLKAKIIFLCTGGEIERWFSNPRLASAHMDYPTLLPALHAATFDSLGHVNEFVTKFWPVWMLLFLLGALASLNRVRAGRNLIRASHLFLIGVLLMPYTLIFAQMEGGTLPMIFFTILGFVECTLGFVEKERVRIGLGLTLLYGAVMCKFEGAFLLSLAAGCMILLPQIRPSWKEWPRSWRLLAFCVLAALPFVYLRVHIPVLDYESGWVGYALAHPVITFGSLPLVSFITLAELFMGPHFAQWCMADGRLHWAGQWEGWSSFYNHRTFGLPWLCILLTILLWRARPTRRPMIVWTLAVFFGFVLALSLVCASFVSLQGINAALAWRVGDVGTNRYLYPVLLAWTATMVTLFAWDSAPSALAKPLTSSRATVAPASRGLNGGRD